ncbi:hypothetical protein D917_10659 [Trichinella nativa]|uniref:Uncharacterized protein n=1 Tax=Trichinella nativa TaxID=6335 RepID=A0A1Y3EDC2_9BILA|nr:hypothetical protein D917_10659 [Trichinella nativa]
MANQYDLWQRPDLKSSTEASQLQNDKLAAFREVWTKFIENLKNCTVSSQHCQVRHSRIYNEVANMTARSRRIDDH